MTAAESLLSGSPPRSDCLGLFRQSKRGDSFRVWFGVSWFVVVMSEHEVEVYDGEILADGGSRTQYYWSGDEGVVYHSESGDGLVDPFFGSVEEAERYLESLADLHGEDQYTGLVLRKTGNQRVEEATEVLTEQSGLTDW